MQQDYDYHDIYSVGVNGFNTFQPTINVQPEADDS